MLTRCPHCQTAFRVTSEQLKVRQGKVRCGACREVFDALETLADEAVAVQPAVLDIPEAQEAREDVEATQELILPEPLVAMPEEAPPPPEPQPVELEPFAVLEAPAEPGPEVAVEAQTAAFAEAAEEAAEESRPPQDGAPSVEDVASSAPVAEKEAQPAEVEPEADADAEGRAATQAEEIEGVAEVTQPRRWPWLSGIALLLILALGQALYFFRVELAVMTPELRPALAGACEAFGCALPRPRKPELVGIESSDLAPSYGNRLQLTAMLKNRAPFDQEYPHLELTLTDTRDEPLLRKVLAPADYLPAEKPAVAGFTAQGEVAVNLALEAEGVPAIGYRLYLFYP
jgi:predicted Zn finger-like uncharacterized protein